MSDPSLRLDTSNLLLAVSSPVRPNAQVPPPVNQTLSYPVPVCGRQAFLRGKTRQENERSVEEFPEVRIITNYLRCATIVWLYEFEYPLLTQALCALSFALSSHHEWPMPMFIFQMIAG